MLDKKKLDRRRRRRRDGSIDLMADADDQIRELIDAMNEAANVFLFNFVKISLRTWPSICKFSEKKLFNFSC